MSKEYMVLLPKVAKIIVFDEQKTNKLDKKSMKINKKEGCFDFSMIFWVDATHTSVV